MFTRLYEFWFSTTSEFKVHSKLFLKELESRDVPSSVMHDENQSLVFVPIVESLETDVSLADLNSIDAYEYAFAETNLAAKGDNLPEKNGKWKDKDGKEIPRQDVIDNGGNGWWHSAAAGTKPIEFKDGRPDFTPHTVKDKNKPIEVEIPYNKDKDGKALDGKDSDRDKHFKTAEDEWKKKNPTWVKPDNTTWHHQSYDPATGKGTMILVPTPIHKPVPHTGSFSDYKKDMESKKQPSVVMTFSDNLYSSISTNLMADDENPVSTTLMSFDSDMLTLKCSLPNFVAYSTLLNSIEEYDYCPLIVVV